MTHSLHRLPHSSVHCLVHILSRVSPSNSAAQWTKSSANFCQKKHMPLSRWPKILQERTTAWCANALVSVKNTTSHALIMKKIPTTKRVPRATLKAAGTALRRDPERKRPDSSQSEKSSPKGGPKGGPNSSQKMNPKRSLEEMAKRIRKARSGRVSHSDATIIRPGQVEHIGSGGYNDIWLVSLREDQQVSLLRSPKSQSIAQETWLSH